jgi:hypothetical protein
MVPGDDIGRIIDLAKYLPGHRIFFPASAIDNISGYDDGIGFFFQIIDIGDMSGTESVGVYMIVQFHTLRTNMQI